MDYFIIKQSGTISIPGEPRSETQTPDASKPAVSSPEISIRAIDDIAALDRFDFIAADTLISDRLKMLLEQYLPAQTWKPCVFINPSRKLQKTFWYLPPLPYQPEQIIYGTNGIPSAISVSRQDFARKSPGIFRIRSHKGPYVVIVHLSVAESILRRGICGLELVRL